MSNSGELSVSLIEWRTLAWRRVSGMSENPSLTVASRPGIERSLRRVGSGAATECQMSQSEESVIRIVYEKLNAISLISD